MESVSLELETAAGCIAAGVDEAGRGPLAGGVHAAAVSCPVERAAELAAVAGRGVNDSKKLSPAKREVLAGAIKSAEGCSWAVASASAAEIDGLNILRATHLAMRRALEALLAKTECNIGLALVDGLPVPGLPIPSKTVIRGDAKSLLIAAASILAKTARDAECRDLERKYPGYGFAKHKGYPTKSHLDALARLGPCPEHRMTFGPVAALRAGTQ